LAKQGLSGLDLHQLSIREANLQGVNLHDTSLAQATLRDSLLTEALDAVYSIAFSTNGTYWAAGDRQGQVRVWLHREQRLRFAWKAHHTVVSSLAISADEQRLATGCWDGIIQVRDLTNGTLVWTSPAVDAVLALAFSMDARVLVSAESNGQIRMWDAASGRLLQTLEEHAGLIFSVVWSPDGKILVRDGYDPHIRLWELAEDDSGQFKLKLIKTLDGHTYGLGVGVFTGWANAGQCELGYDGPILGRREREAK
jgi:WD40 repeat protein